MRISFSTSCGVAPGHDVRTLTVRTSRSGIICTGMRIAAMIPSTTSTPTTVASAAPDCRPNRLMAAATASSKKLLAPISADGAATQCWTPNFRFSQ